MSERDRFQYKWWALLGLSVLAFTAFLDATIVNTALPFIQTALKTNIFQLQWVASIFTIVLSMTMIAIGKFADLLGRKKVFYVFRSSLSSHSQEIGSFLDWSVDCNHSSGASADFFCV